MGSYNGRSLQSLRAECLFGFVSGRRFEMRFQNFCLFTFAVNGGWGEWKVEEKCTSTCGDDGVEVQSRECNNPAPKCSGLQCLGQEKKTVPCNRVPCAIKCTYGNRTYGVGVEIIDHPRDNKLCTMW